MEISSLTAEEKLAILQTIPDDLLPAEEKALFVKAAEKYLLRKTKVSASTKEIPSRTDDTISDQVCDYLDKKYGEDRQSDPPLSVLIPEIIMAFGGIKSIKELPGNVGENLRCHIVTFSDGSVFYP